MAGIARSVATHGRPVAAPAVLLSGGETTVSIGRGPAGRGGRNTEFLLALAVALASAPNIWAIAGDSDGIDGTEDALARLSIRTPSPAPGPPSSTHDSYTVFDGIRDLVRTGPTMTNVNDIRAILITPPR
jgi:hydroxypyruvate reductase